MTRVEMIFDSDCPNVESARWNLRNALLRVGMPPRWQEWDRNAVSTPLRLRPYGSPTILVDGQDVSPSPLPGGGCCRLYFDESGRTTGLPTVKAIVLALSRTGESEVGGETRGRSQSTLVALPAIGSALLPKLTCPACWPAYAGLLSSTGLGFVNYTPYLLPLTTLFLILAVSSLGYRARARRGYRPFLMGVLGAIFVVVGKFVLLSDPAMYGGIALLVAASFWNSWPRKGAADSLCPVCVPMERR